MGKFLRNLLLALIPVAVINALCWGTLVYLAWQDDLTYVNYASALDKEKRLEELANQPRLIIIGGSNARFGFDSGILKDTLHIEPVNMGIHIGLGMNYMFEEVSDYLQKGDVLLVSAEYDHFLDEDAYYGDEGLTDMYLIKHEWGKALCHVIDTHNFLSIYRLIRKRVKRIGMNVKDIPVNMEVRTKYNEFGDYTGHYNLPSPGHWSIKPLPTVSPDKEVLADLSEKVSSLTDRGVKVLFLPPPYCRSSYQTDSLVIGRISDSLKSSGLPFYLNPSECVYPDSLFYDSRYHLIKDGVGIHSRKIARELKSALE